jgi:acyl-CoA synthetase (AMP-forming)/AMP-acid ligase II
MSPNERPGPPSHESSPPAGFSTAARNGASSTPTSTLSPATAFVPRVGGKITLTQSLKRAAQINGGATATVCHGRRHTWKELEERVARLAGGLRQIGVQDGDRIAILSLNSDRYLEYGFAVPWAGAVEVPLNIRWAVPEHSYSLNDCGATVLIVDDAFQALIPQIRAGTATLKTVVFAGDGTLPDGMLSYETLVTQSAPIADRLRGGDDLAGIFYTGGTTGFPKGVMLSHLALWSNAMSTMHEANVSSDSICLHAAPMFHLADAAGSNAASIGGATHVFIPMFNPEQVMAIVAQERPTHSVLVPTMIAALVNHPAIDSADLSSLRFLSYGGSPIPEATLRTAMEKLPNCQFVQAYGQTELAPVATILPPEYHALEGPKSGKLRSAGRPTHCVELKIVDPAGQELPRGEIGEIIVSGPNTMLGYWNKPQETASTLVDGWVHTGDSGYMDGDGFVFIMDRLKDMIVTGGENVYSIEVENAVAAYPGVASCAVIAIPDDTWGEVVHAVVVMKPGVQATAEDIISHCHALIANYKCPRSVSFQESLPMTGAGKVLKRELRDPYWKGKQRQVN